MSLEQFAHRVVETFVLRERLSSLLETIGHCGIPPDKISSVEAVIYASFPYTTLPGTFESKAFRFGILDATAEQIAGTTSMMPMQAKRFVGERTRQYTIALFEEENGTLQVAENGLLHLAKLAFRNITGDQPPSVANMVRIWGYFTTTLDGEQGGVVLEKQYELYEQIGDEEWLKAMREF